MIKIITGLIFIILIIITIFVLYPDTGKYEEYMFYGSIALWSFLYIYFTLNLKIFSLFPFSLFLNILFFIFMIFITSIILPQEDGKTILSKILSGKFPDPETINRGKIKYLKGLFTTDIKINTNNLQKETKKFFDKIKD
ncbi:MAG: hypothetical protein K6357_03630 [Elusimicrobiota bacterium]